MEKLCLAAHKEMVKLNPIKSGDVIEMELPSTSTIKDKASYDHLAADVL